MKAKEQAPTAPTEAEKEKFVPEDMETTLPPAEQPVDPKEEARRRSKEDLKRQRSRQRNKRGTF